MKQTKLCLAVLGFAYSLTAWGVQPLLCLIQPDNEAEVGSPVVGVVKSVHVERGDVVRKGQVLARLRSRVEAASLKVAKTRAQADADVRAAHANYQYLKKEYVRAVELFEQNFISAAALEKARAETKIAAEKYFQAQKQLDVWKREVELAEAQLELRAIRAPFAGIITERHITVGERIEDKPMFRIARVDPLRVEVVVPANMFGTVTSDMVARVTPDLPSLGQFDAEIVLIDRFVDAASNTFRVRASMPNPDGAIPSGLRCTAQLIEMPATDGPHDASNETVNIDKPSARASADPSMVRKLQVDTKIESELSNTHRGTSKQ
ncbi:MAG: efflux RND transporter periplasmic adaptor subunit [Betaproteobacteria bacterium]|nr:MAG: efflux RND transporter periplasmic adaptor subunit [Betaproteobacteria bacterium]